MSKKTLLSESQVRQFMKLAQLAPLTPGFVNGLTGNRKDLGESHGRGRNEGAVGYGHPDANARLEEEDDLTDLHATEDELSDMDSEDDREGDEIDDLEGELDAADDGDLDGGGQMISVDDLMAALTSALEDVTGQPVEATVEDEVEADVELDVVDDLDVDAADMEADTDMEMDDEMLEEADDPKDVDDKKKSTKDAWDRRQAAKPAEKNESVNATDKLVEQITKRVAARILKSALAKK